MLADDMPRLSDTGRIVRIAMMLDEVRQIALHYRTDRLDRIRDSIDPCEFVACGGRRSRHEGRTHSLYRQLVYARRDAASWSKRGCPSAQCIKRAKTLYAFYPSDDEAVDSDASKVSHKDAHRLKRIAFVLKRFRRFHRTHENALGTKEAQRDFYAISLSKAEFVECGGHKTTSDKLTHSFYRQIVYAVRDVRHIMFESGRFCKSVGDRYNDGDISTDDEGTEEMAGEDVDGRDRDENDDDDDEIDEEEETNVFDEYDDDDASEAQQTVRKETSEEADDTEDGRDAGTTSAPSRAATGVDVNMFDEYV